MVDGVRVQGVTFILVLHFFEILFLRVALNISYLNWIMIGSGLESSTLCFFCENLVVLIFVGVS